VFLVSSTRHVPGVLLVVLVVLVFIFVLILVVLVLIFVLPVLLVVDGLSLLWLVIGVDPVHVG
jgi:hypothetical protein